MTAAGTQTLAQSALDTEALTIPVAHGDTSDGQYEPFTDYDLGDWIGLDDGSSPTIEVHRVVAMTLALLPDGDFSTEINLNSVGLDAFLRQTIKLDKLLGK